MIQTGVLDSFTLKSLCLANNSAINDQTFRKILENCFSVLINKVEVHQNNTILNSKPDTFKELYAALLKSCAEFVRNDVSSDGALEILKNKCNLSPSKLAVFSELFEKNRLQLQVALGNIATHFPHIVDVKWRIDYIVKSDRSDQHEGPIFRVTLVTEKFDEASQDKKVEEINFSCTSQELQDLVYKLKDAERHCSKFGSEN